MVLKVILNADDPATANLGENNQRIYLFQRSSSRPMVDLNKISRHVDYLLKPHSLRYLYRPIVDIPNKDILGYFEYVKAYESPLSGFQEMSQYASKVDKNKELFSVVSNTVITEFVNSVREKKFKLFLSVSLIDINYITEVLSQIPRISECDLVLVFDEQEINENASDFNALSSALISLIRSGHQLSLFLKDKDLLLDNEIYRLFDYFIVGSSMLSEIRKNNRIRLSAYTLIESLMKYKKPIIATDLESWQAVELIIESGISILSSDVVSPVNDMLLPVEKKKMEKLVAMRDKYL